MELRMKSIILLLSFSFVKSHTFLAEPKSAVRTGFGITCQHGWNRNSPCCASKSAANPGATVYARGQEFEFKWPRNNHPGGFIRMSLVPFENSDSQDAFDKNVIQFNCHESNCKSGYGNLFDGDGTADHKNLCSNTLKIPAYLRNGQYTIQWMWMGGSSYYNDKNRGQTTYQNCMDFTIAGNEPVIQRAANSCPLFKGSDAHFPTENKCLYFSPEGTKPGKTSCFPDGCTGKHSSGVPELIEQCKESPASNYIPNNEASVNYSAVNEGSYSGQKCKGRYARKT